ncbi:peptidase M20 [Brevibacillus choshinensis]|uniref:Peptidase M20 n=1 Tax=Brevibacillus choshinensis TaxID=54911 RepID=A0ABR5N7Y7_BRECH|nr:M20/M25/M40 family metallo-hydrolase [Brevibacillus choshinensis]KQL46562.1 peptidase M20 [Brevibacillus choshinensis]
MKRKFIGTAFLTLSLLTSLTPLSSAAAVSNVQSEVVSSETAKLLQELLRFDSTNPGGQTLALAEFLKSKFDKLGVETDVIKTPSGQAHFIARLKGNGTKKPVLLAAHSDVVPVERKNWTVDPFGGVIKDGYVMGRGAMDFKGGLAVFAQAVMMVKEKNVSLDRDVIFLAEADEEAGEYGTEWLAKNYWEKIDAEFALNEGGWIFQDADGKTTQVNITTRDKIYVSFKLTASGKPTHSSRPMPDSAIKSLSLALTKITNWDTDPTLNDQTREYFLALSRTAKEPLASHLKKLAESKDPSKAREAGEKVVELGSYPLLWHALMRNTVAPTIIQAGVKENVIPGSAEAIINVRLVPGSTPFEVMEQLQNVIADPEVKVSLASNMSEEEAGKYYDQRTKAVPSSTETELYKALAESSKSVWPEAEVVPALFEAGTDGAAWRNRGVPVYGIYPYPLDNDTLERMHGNDERISVNSLEEGTKMIYNTLIKVAGSN